MKIAAAFILLGAALLTSAQQYDWGDGAEEDDSPEFETSRALCRSLRDREPPAAHRPTARQATTLRGCDSEALYYGIGRTADPVLARQCAFLEADREDAPLFGGRVMLMTIYANGAGVERDLDLAIHLACGIEGAPMESHGRVSRLAELKESDWAGSDFHFCEQATSGLIMGHCAAHEARIAGARRTARLNQLIAGWSPRQKLGLAPLQQAHAFYVEAHGNGEIDLSGTMRGALQIGAEEALRDEFVGMIERLDSGREPIASRAQFQAADHALNEAYRQRLRGEFGPGPGAVTREGIRAAQRAWLGYRDAFLRFAAVKYPRVSRDSLATWLTRQRTALLTREE